MLALIPVGAFIALYALLVFGGGYHGRLPWERKDRRR